MRLQPLCVQINFHMAAISFLRYDGGRHGCQATGDVPGRRRRGYVHTRRRTPARLPIRDHPSAAAARAGTADAAPAPFRARRHAHAGRRSSPEHGQTRRQRAAGRRFADRRNARAAARIDLARRWHDRGAVHLPEAPPALSHVVSERRSAHRHGRHRHAPPAAPRTTGRPRAVDASHRCRRSGRAAGAQGRDGDHRRGYL